MSFIVFAEEKPKTDSAIALSEATEKIVGACLALPKDRFISGARIIKIVSDAHGIAQLPPGRTCSVLSAVLVGRPIIFGPKNSYKAGKIEVFKMLARDIKMTAIQTFAFADGFGNQQSMYSDINHAEHASYVLGTKVLKDLAFKGIVRRIP